MANYPLQLKPVVLFCVTLPCLPMVVFAGEDRKPTTLDDVAGRAGRVVIESDVEYGRAGERPLTLDILRPTKPVDDVLPAIVYIHGGGWQRGDKSWGLASLYPLAASGKYFTVSINYRLSGEKTWPAQIHDCKAAIRWLRANAERLKIDCSRIGVWGGSAGGHLASLIGTLNETKQLEGNCGSAGYQSHVACVVNFCGPGDLVALARAGGDQRGKDAAVADAAINALLDGPVNTRVALAREASPITYVSKSSPPFLIIHGTDDQLIPIKQAKALHSALEKAGADTTLVRVIGGGHNFGCPDVAERAATFFEKHLRGKDLEVSSNPIREPRLVAVEAITRIVGSWQWGASVVEWKWADDKQCAIGTVAAQGRDSNGTLLMRFDPASGGILCQECYPAWGVRENCYTEISQKQWRGHSILKLNSGAIQTSTVVLEWTAPDKFENRYTNGLLYGDIPQKESGHEFKKIVPMDRVYTFTKIETAKKWPEVVNKIRRQTLPRFEKMGGTLYGLWHPVELEDGTRFEGLLSNELILMVAWPPAVIDRDSKLVDSSLRSLTEFVSSTETSIVEPVALPHGPVVRTGPGFYVLRTNRYKLDDVSRVVRLSEEAWVTFEPEFGAEVVGLFRESPDQRGMARMTRIGWYPSFEAWKKSREFTRDPESLKRFVERQKLTVDGVGVAAGFSADVKAVED